MKAILLAVIFFVFLVGLALIAALAPLRAKGEVAGDSDEP